VNAGPANDDPVSDPAEVIGYAAAMAELETILRDLEDGEVDIDHLASQVRRGAELVRHCRGRLADANTEVIRIVAELDGEVGPDVRAGDEPYDEPDDEPAIDRP
jgi:exodeoxyribonuclease VII small subunit